jgi:hypothetical protein
MSINQTFANTAKHKNSIDFEINENFKSADFKNSTNKNVGELIINNQRFQMSQSDLDYLSDTCNRASEIIHKKYKLGLM